MPNTVERESERERETDRNFTAPIGSGEGDGLGSNVPNSPNQTRADHLSLNWVHCQAILIPFPKFQHIPGRKMGWEERE